ncbi:MAG: type III-A CRISPR-associated protein Csm2 [Kaiparowitsia implicata GSE-PSE-MK54-09C]|jgi:CRISPR-associated protein Csm2|nr:type III-A CRISPR-associated protein Csm2 [Kaiparowitsia implicata GSE-PSE-MK54-09C]
MPDRPAVRPQHNPPRDNRPRDNRPRDNQTGSTSKQIIDEISGLNNLQNYDIRTLVKHAEEFGPFLRNRRLETNQIRKFLDAINRLKAQLTQGDTEGSVPKDDSALFADIETDIVLLKPKLAYAAARQEAAKPLSEVMAVAIDRVHSLKDFERLVQLVESIIAYHKAEGGR